MPNQGDAWDNVVEALQRDLDEAEMRSVAAPPDAAAEAFAFPLGIGALLGQRTAELHKALATPTDDPAFAVEPIDAGQLAAWSREVAQEFDAVVDAARRGARPPAAGAGR